MARNGNSRKEEVIVVKTGLCGAKLLPGEEYVPKAEILSGGVLLDPPAANGQILLAEDFNKRVPIGAHCIHNPKPGSMVSQKFGL